jgi:hypothetical protein
MSTPMILSLISAGCRQLHFAASRHERHFSGKEGAVVMRIFIVAGTIFLTMFTAGTAIGQTTPSPSEQQEQDINRSLLQQGRRLQQNEQNQFNFDQMQLNQDLRNEGNLRPPDPYRRGCPVKSVGC